MFRTAGGEAVTVVVNVAMVEAVEAMIETAVKTYGRLDILINNAGIMDRAMPVADCSDDLWKLWPIPPPSRRWSA